MGGTISVNGPSGVEYFVSHYIIKFLEKGGEMRTDEDGDAVLDS